MLALRHLLHISALVRQEAPVLATLCDRTTWIHDRDEQLGAGMGGVKNGTLFKKIGVTLPTAKKSAKKTGKGPCFCFLNGRVSLYTLLAALRAIHRPSALLAALNIRPPKRCCMEPACA